MRLPFRQVVILLAVAVCVAYLGYRGFFTLNLTTHYTVFASLLLYGAECYFVALFLLFFLQVWRLSEPVQQPVLEGRSVDVFVPTYNEDVHMLRKTLTACLQMDYAHQTYVLDDGKRAEVKALADELGVHYITRPDNQHAKAGNLNHALGETDGEFVVFLDADHVPQPNFITRLIGYFHDEKLAFVQTPHAYYNFDSFQALIDYKKRKYWDEGELFYQVVQPGRNHWNAANFTGSGAMFRRRALEDVGNIATETITEDLHTSLRLHARGWKSLGISERLLVGQAATDVTTFHSQRLRWGEGNLSIFAYDNPLTVCGLSFAQRLCYLASMIHWGRGLFMLAIWLTPVLTLFAGIAPVADFTWVLGLFLGTYLVVCTLSFRVASAGHGSLWNTELFNLVAFYTQIRALFRAVFRRRFQKFVVTSKRGRQSDRVWPFIWPQVMLIGVSVLAIFWGWYRVAVGLSEDWFEPALASFWVTLYVALAIVDVRRSLWPDNQRCLYRHLVNLPVAYRLVRPEAAGRPHFGITADLNDAGLSLIAHEELPVGALMRVCLQGAGEVVECTALVCWVKPIYAGSAAAVRGYRCGIAFQDLSERQADRLNRICLQYGAPRLYSEFDARRQRTVMRHLSRWTRRRINSRRAARRHELHLPLILQSEQAQEPIFTITEDISRNALATLLDVQLMPQTAVRLTLPLPQGEVDGTARVLRNEVHSLGGRDYYRCVLEFEDLDPDQQARLARLLDQSPPDSLEAVFKPDYEPVRVSLLRPALFSLLVLVPLLLVEPALFRHVYRDDFFLLDAAGSSQPLTPDQQARLQEVYLETTRDRFPTNHRLALLIDALKREDRWADVAGLTRILSRRHPRDLDLQVAYAQALDRNGNPAGAVEEFRRLLREIDEGRVPAARRDALLLAAARASDHAGQPEAAIGFYRQAVGETPDPALRAELAGVLVRQDRLTAAAQVLREGALTDDGRLLLATVDYRLGDYPSAVREARAILDRQPDQLAAGLLLADAYSRLEEHQAAMAVLAQLQSRQPKNQEIQLRLAFTALSLRDFGQAAQRFGSMIDEGHYNAQVIAGYIDAASSLEKPDSLRPATVQMVVKRAALPPLADDPVCLARLGWLLVRLDEPGRGGLFLERAAHLQPTDPVVRRAVASALEAAGKYRLAIRMYDGVPLTLEDRLRLGSLHAAEKDFDLAEKQYRAVLQQDPGHRAAQRSLADVLVWQKEYAEALGLLDQLARHQPTDVQLQQYLAEVTLWSGDHAGALPRFQKLIEQSPGQQLLWRGFTDAAAGAPFINEAAARTAVQIAERVLADPPNDVPFLSRLAWVLHRTGELTRSGAVLDRAVALRPQDPAVRKELARVLGAAGKFGLAVQLLDGLDLNAADREMLAHFYLAVKKFDAAEKECRSILRSKPGDRDARLLLADILTWKQSYQDAADLLEALRAELPEDARIQVKAAQVALWGRDYTKALERFQQLLTREGLQPELMRPFIDAAAGVQALDPKYRPLLLQIYEKVMAGKPSDPVMLSRLAWALRRLDESKKSALVLRMAQALQPDSRALKLELAQSLYAAGEYAEAEKYFRELLEEGKR